MSMDLTDQALFIHNSAKNFMTIRHVQYVLHWDIQSRVKI